MGDSIQLSAQAQASERPAALREALELLLELGATVLEAERLRDVARSPRELVALLDWLAEAGAELVVADVALDTRTDAGRAAVGLVRELERIPRDPSHGGPPRGRPGIVAHAPELAGEIAAMREQGMSLQAIADALNARAIPTPRGGARWRASSVQSLLGYRRPHPPGPRPQRPPGPPPPPPPHRPGGRPPHPPGGPPPHPPGPR